MMTMLPLTFCNTMLVVNRVVVIPGRLFCLRLEKSTVPLAPPPDASQRAPLF